VEHWRREVAEPEERAGSTVVAVAVQAAVVERLAMDCGDALGEQTVD
jgi:hypothetical protein